MRRVVLPLVTAVALTFVVVPSTSAAPSTGLSTPTFDKRLQNQTNKARKANEAGALKFGRCLDRFAQRQANRMARQQRMFHQDLSIPLSRCRAQTVGENVAHGFQTPRSNIRGWMNSPGHRSNMLSRSFTRLGVGVAMDASGHTWTAQVFGRPA
jgi:uncharacterized protein YkwD